MRLHLISVPYDSGVPDVRMGLGPGRLLDAGLARHLESLGHEVSHRELRAPDAAVASEVATSFALNAALSGEVRHARGRGELPVVLAGSCYTAVGTVSGLGAEAGADGVSGWTADRVGGDGPVGAAADPVGVVWLDTHADLNTPETTASGFLDGMALSMLTGEAFSALANGIAGFRPLPPEHLLLVGTRDVDPPERGRIADMGIGVLPPGALDPGLDAALAALRSRVARVYLHVDLDVLDPSEAPANTFVAPDGLSVDALVRTVDAVRRAFEVGAVAFTAYDPSVDPEGRVPEAVTRVVETLLA